MDITDVISTIIIFLVFGGVLVANIYATSIEEIRKDWPKYKCNPIYMPFAKIIDDKNDVVQNMQECLKSMSGDVMKKMLSPLLSIFDKLKNIMKGIMDMVKNILGFLDRFRDQLMQQFVGVFSIFGGILKSFNNLQVATNNMVNQMMAVVITFSNMMTGSILFLTSMYKGPPGKMMKMLSPKGFVKAVKKKFCFDPNTKLKLQSGKIIKIKNISLGDILENGSKVEAILKIDNRHNKLPLCKILSKDKQLNKYIFVTESHKIQDPISSRFIPVSNYSGVIHTNKIIDEFTCLVTDDHLIKIGDNIFWDWED